MHTLHSSPARSTVAVFVAATLLVAGLVSATGSPAAAATTTTVSDQASCEAAFPDPGATWNGTLDLCVLKSDATVASSDSLVIVSPVAIVLDTGRTLTVDGEVDIKPGGRILQRGGDLTIHGLVTNGGFWDVRGTGQLVNASDGTLVTNHQLHLIEGSVVDNDGAFTNDGQISLSSRFENSGSFLNTDRIRVFGTFANTGSVDTTAGTFELDCEGMLIDNGSFAGTVDPTICFLGTGNWNDASRWSTGSVPGSSEPVEVRGTATIVNDRQRSAETLVTGRLVVADGATLTTTSDHGTLRLPVAGLSDQPRLKVFGHLGNHATIFNDGGIEVHGGLVNWETIKSSVSSSLRNFGGVLNLGSVQGGIENEAGAEFRNFGDLKLTKTHNTNRGILEVGPLGTLTLHNTLVNKSGGQLLNRGLIEIEHALNPLPLLENESGAVLLNDTDAEIHVVDSDSALTNDGNVENRDKVINHGSTSNTGSWCGPGSVGPDGVTGTAPATSCLPGLDLGPDRNVDEGSLLTLSRDFHDPGVPTEFAASVDWGDGTTDTAILTSSSLVTQRLTASHAYADNGRYTATAEVCDGGDCTSDDITVTVANVPPDVTLPAVGPAPEGLATTFTFTASDAGTADALSVPGGVDCGTGGSLEGGSLAFDGTTGSFDCVFADGPSIQTVSVTVQDDDGGATTVTRAVSVLNVSPTVHSLMVEEDPVQVNTPATASASFSDPGEDTFTSVFDWDDGTTSAGSLTGETTTSSHPYGAAGLYFMGVSVTDDDGGSDTLASETPIIVYDPDAGRLAVGATYESPPGAHVDDPTRTETVRAAGSAGYRPGDDRPSGRLRVAGGGDVLLEATAFDWLVVTPSTSYLHGSGEWLGQPGMSFLFSAQSGSDGSGLLRLQVWDVQGDRVYDTDQKPDRYAAPTTEIIRGSVARS